MITKIRFMILAVFALLLVIPFSSAASCGTTPSGLSSSTSSCIPISIQNTQSSALTTNTQVMVTFNAKNYSAYLNGNLQNIYLYNSSSGTTAPAWIEGNVSNEQQITNLNTSVNVIVWLKLPEALAGSSTDTNWRIGVGNLSTNFFATSGAKIGESPILSSTYGEYDNGASVFNNYWNFAGTTLPATLTATTGTNGAITVKNGVTIALSAGAWGTYITTASTLSAPLVIDSYGEQVTQSTGPAALISTIWTGSSTIANASYALFDFSPNASSTVSNFGLVTAYENGGVTFPWATTGNEQAGNNNFNVQSLFINSVGNMDSAYMNYNSYSASSSALAITSGYIGLQTTQDSAIFQWLRTRTYPPSGIQPTVTGGALTLSVTLSVTISPSTTQTLDSGQSVSFTSSTSGGTSPYTYQWYSSTTSSCSSSSTLLSGQTSSSLTISPTSTIYYCLVSTDSASNTRTSPATEVIVNPSLFSINQVLGTWTSQNSLINNFFVGSCVVNNNNIFCADGNGGTTVESAPITNNVIGTWTSQNSLQANPNGFDGGSCIVNNNNIYCITGDDTVTSESAPITNNVIGTWSIQNNLINDVVGGSCVINNNNIYCADGSNTVESAPITNNVIGTWTSQNSLLSNLAGGSCVINNNNIYCINGNSANTVESAPITNNVIGTWTSQNSLLKNFNYGSCAINNNNIFCATSENNYRSVESAPITNNVIGTWTSQNSLLSNLVGGSCVINNNNIYCINGNSANTVESAPINTHAKPFNATYDSGQAISLTYSPSGGTTPYTYQWYNDTSGTGVLMSGQTASTLSLTAGLAQTVKYYIKNIDSATTPASITSYEGTYLINSKQLADSWTASNNPVLTGQYETFNVVISGGTSPYTYSYSVYNSFGDLVASESVINSSTSNTFTIQQLSSWGTGTFMANITTTDSATTPTSTSNTLTYTVNNGLAAGAITPSNPTIKAGQKETLTANASGGVTPYTYKWYSGTSATCSSDSLIVGATSSTYVASPNSNTYYCYTVNDSSKPNYTATSTTDLVTVIPWELISVTSNATAYETSTQGFVYKLNLSSAYTTAKVKLEVYNGSNLLDTLWNNQTIATQPQSFTFAYPVPMLLQNRTILTFNASLELDSTSEGQVNSLTQNELFNYYPTFAIKKSNIIEGDNQTVFINITQKKVLNNANVSSEVNIGNKSIIERVSSLYHYYAAIYSFINSKYNLTMPTKGNPITINAAVPINLSFGNSKVERNVSGTFDSYLPLVISCNATTSNTLNWNFYNASSTSVRWPDNVLLQGYYQIVNNLFTGNVINGTDAGITSTATSNRYATCIYPNFASFQLSGGFKYSSVNTSIGNYYLRKMSVSNTLQNINLYLANITTPIEYEVAVENITSGVYIPALVQELRYNPNTNTSVLVDEFYTSGGSGTYIYLDSGISYKFNAYTTSYPNTLLATTNYLTAAACSTTACPYVIQVGNFSVKLISSILKNFQYSCSATTPVKNSSAVSCSFTSINGTSYNTSLLVLNNSYSIENTTACYKSVVTSSGSLSCTVNGLNKSIYDYYFRVKLGGKYGEYTLWTGTLGTKPLAFGLDGVFLALLILVSVSFIFITKNPTITVILFDVGFTIMSFIGLINAGLATIGFMWVASAFLIYIINRR